MNDKSIRDYINLIENAQRGEEMDSDHATRKYWSDPENVAQELYKVYRGAPIGKADLALLWKTNRLDSVNGLEPDVGAILSTYEVMSGRDPLFSGEDIAGEQLEETTPDAISKIDRLFRDQ